MQIHLERPDYSQILYRANGQQARVNEHILTRSFVLAPDQLIQSWPPTSVAELTTEHLHVLLRLNPALVILGTGEKQVFPPASMMALCLSRGIGIEIMNNAAAGRTFNILAGESRHVVAGFLLSSTTAL